MKLLVPGLDGTPHDELAGGPAALALPCLGGWEAGPAAGSCGAQRCGRSRTGAACRPHTTVPGGEQRGQALGPQEEKRGLGKGWNRPETSGSTTAGAGKAPPPTADGAAVAFASKEIGAVGRVAHGLMDHG